MKLYRMVIFLLLFQDTNNKESKSQYRTMTKTRKYVIDGQVVTTQTSKIIVTGEENKNKEEHELW